MGVGEILLTCDSLHSRPNDDEGKKGEARRMEHRQCEPCNLELQYSTVQYRNAPTVLAGSLPETIRTPALPIRLPWLSLTQAQVEGLCLRKLWLKGDHHQARRGRKGRVEEKKETPAYCMWVE